MVSSNDVVAHSISFLGPGDPGCSLVSQLGLSLRRSLEDCAVPLTVRRTFADCLVVWSGLRVSGVSSKNTVLGHFRVCVSPSRFS